jgi:hypothetical protein
MTFFRTFRTFSALFRTCAAHWKSTARTSAAAPSYRGAGVRCGADVSANHRQIFPHRTARQRTEAQ